MKKKLLLIIGMFLFITNVNALTFDVNLTNIEDKGNNGTIGQITNMDVTNKTIDTYFQDIGDEVNFELTVTNTGDRAGTLRSITITPSNDKMEYTTNLPEGGLAINGNDFNTVEVKAKVLAGAQNGTSSSEIKINYTYDEGSCPEGEILSDDESMCLCPEGKERNETGICVVPEKEDKIECKDDEIYNETKKICEKKVAPVPDDTKPDGKITPNNPKTMDNIILITLLFFVSGLGIYAVLFKKLKTKKARITAGAITGVATLSLSFTVLAGVFGLDNLLGAIINPITKNKEVTVTVNETIDLIETWDGNCDLNITNLTPQNIFDGGSGTESDPYKIRTAEQLSCFAKSINNGTTYSGKFIKQTKNIKLNDHLNDNIAAGTTDELHTWTPAGLITYTNGQMNANNSFNGTYDGDDHTISGLYILPIENASYQGLFGKTVNATIKNLELSDVYVNVPNTSGVLIGYASNSLSIDSVKTYGTMANCSSWSSGIVSYIHGANSADTIITIENSTNNVNLMTTSGSFVAGIVGSITSVPNAEEPNIIFRNDVNNGKIVPNGSSSSGVLGYVTTNANILFENVGNTGEYAPGTSTMTMYGGIAGEVNATKVTLRNCYNTGKYENNSDFGGGRIGGLVGQLYVREVIVDNCYNSGDIIAGPSFYEGTTTTPQTLNVAGLLGNVSGGVVTMTNSYNTGNISGNLGDVSGLMNNGGSSSNLSVMENCYNTGDIAANSYVGGLVSGSSAYITINKSYNSGKVTKFGGSQMGGIFGHSGISYIYNSYNSGEIVNVSPYGGSENGGLCANGCREIKNSYNSGNITSTYGGMLGGISSGGQIIENVFNAGDINFLGKQYTGNTNGANVLIGGIRYNGSNYAKNVYNLGDINVTLDGVKLSSFNIHGLTSVSYYDVIDSVNAGNITITVKQPTTFPSRSYIGGISNTRPKNCFNGGTITFDDSALDEPINMNISEYNYISIGQITTESTSDYSNYTGNKWNTDANGLALGCYGKTPYCTLEESASIGSYTTESTPDILSIINGDDAFEIKEGDTLPTLKVFNE